MYELNTHTFPSHFYSRASARRDTASGEYLDRIAISTHAPLRGATSGRKRDLHEHEHFYSRASARRDQ